ncbi:outer membrane protein [Halorhodospira halochloris]|uniref:Outer membrane protein n=1 Tax=Halorhodospira halochloris TaxID=1052 RepID=A0A0X8XAI1_HALHR|nr:BamA/TamA family outer membrane protein [Halorhodospira halochloris]MBK1652842.1 hypothetical protein [Halorhodospira halochloris]BAU58052.1 outer membrane protein [Halorhodospira halochloris]
MNYLSSLSDKCRAVRVALFSALLVFAPLSQAERDSGTIYLPLAFYSPDTGAGISYTMLYFSSRELQTGVSGTDTIRVTALYTQEDQHMASIGASWFIGRGLWKVSNNATTQNFPRDFYGIGATTPEEDEEEYTYERHSNLLALQRWMGNEWYVGGVFEANRSKITEFQDDDQGLIREYYSDNNLEMSDTFHGVGIQINRDSTDAPFFPRHGSKTSLRALAYPEDLGANQAFERYDLSQRLYLPLGREGALALEIQGEYASDGAPIPFLPSLGSGSTLRGYAGGRYMDQLYLSGQAEVRFPIQGRWQGTVFTAAGDVFPDFDDISDDNLKYGVGGGIRYALQQDMRINLRLDIAYGFATGDAEDGESPGVYFNFTEAF